MTITVDLNDELVKKVERYTQIKDYSELVNEALRSLIVREAARSIGRMGGTAPDFEVPGRPIPPLPQE
jgi:metal-responsive CopG/Arc/MetJ family transcriptional regulator